MIGDSYVDNGETSTIVCGMNWHVACRRYLGDIPLIPISYTENMELPDSDTVILTSLTLGDVINKVSLLFDDPNLMLSTDSVFSLS